ncbi:class I SAM-dependent methyltransferase [Agromyces seonyuensis]|uniref:Methyltransferase domain-containing protein n=1 Tax=Agromyces seonyuensis TaxID=2662446 RepID=A0A6I4P3N2_9MICO|nr:class I SAM-dependent methyltransferase [Agromyces seonyuensis]MWC00333.1 methyltransferase domain-containing protein [Agromyces seonyuensis]
MTTAVRDAYARRSDEYTELIGSIDAVHELDRVLVASWAAQLDGTVLDAGCGPGHWTRFLVDQGADARGLDQVPEFLAHARARHPGIRYELGDLDALPGADGALAGILSWYSLIHHEPGEIGRPLSEFARVLRPGGGLLIGCFVGPTTEPFDHAVVRAHRWNLDELAAELASAGFDVLETHTRTNREHRPHGAILARRTRGG